MSYNQEPPNMILLKDTEFANGMLHFILGVPQFRQPFINSTPMSGCYNLKMFPLAYQDYEHLGYAMRIDLYQKVKFYRYGDTQDWKKLEQEMVNQFSNDNS